MKAIFQSIETMYSERNGCVVLAEPLNESLYDRDEVGPMYEVCDGYGNTWHAFADELTPA